MRIYGKSNDQRLLEDSKLFSKASEHDMSSTNGGSSGAAAGLRINVNRQVRVSMDNFMYNKPRNGSSAIAAYKKVGVYLNFLILIFDFNFIFTINQLAE